MVMAQGRSSREIPGALKCGGFPGQPYPVANRARRLRTPMAVPRAVAPILLAVAAMCIAPDAPAQVEPGQKPYRIGWLASGAAPSIREVFLSAFKERGWTEGRDFRMEYRLAGAEPRRFEALARELVEARVDVIVAANHSAVDAAMRATNTIPIVMGVGGDPVGMGWVKSLAQPGGNVTGMASIVTPETAGKRLEMLREVVPQLDKVAVLWWPGSKDPYSILRALRDPGRRLGIALVSLPVGKAEDIEPAFEAAARERAQALIAQGDVLLFQHRRKIAELANARRLPASYAWTAFAEAGGFMSYGPSIPEFFRRAADYVDRILKGAKPGDLAIEQPTQFELVMNVKTANALGITIPPSLLVRADRVIE